jgi:hypothetical protein
MLGLKKCDLLQVLAACMSPCCGCLPAKPCSVSFTLGAINSVAASLRSRVHLGVMESMAVTSTFISGFSSWCLRMLATLQPKEQEEPSDLRTHLLVGV